MPNSNLTKKTRTNDLFKFVNLRSPKKREIPPINPNIIVHPHVIIDDDKLFGKTMYGKLLEIKNKSTNTSFQNYLDVVGAFKNEKTFISNEESLDKSIPGLAAFQNWMDSDPVNLTAKDVVENAKKHLGKNSINLIKENQLMLWDNLFAYIFEANSIENSSITILICKAISTLNLISCTEQNLVKESDEIKNTYYTNPLIPKWIFELIETNKPTNADENIGTASEKVKTDATQYLKTNRAVLDLEKLRQQKLTGKIKPKAPEQNEVVNSIKKAGKLASKEVPEVVISEVNLLLITKEDLAYLEKDTIVLAKQNGIALEGENIDLVLDTMYHEVSGQLTHASIGNQETHTNIGNAIVSSNEICTQAMQASDPCGVGPRINYTGGSANFTNMYLGDLLVTRQELIKYDLGEVAHIEAVMKSETKERIHRRLNRTEETETTEYETVTESEKETQSTERFEMEKETSKVTSQEFNIDTGINVTTNYGLVTSIEATVNAGFSTASQQSTRTATNFSKDVTNRALDRVKQTIRKQKTITVLNETEETAKHGFNNTDPNADHINGVYRWVDKYYLNKVVNYGQRLMVEFNIPEPANFYIFRNVVKPKVGTQINKPVDFRRWALSFEELNQANYASFAAMYGVTDIEPFPAPEETIGASYTIEPKNLIDAVNITGSPIAIPKGYFLTSINCTGRFIDVKGSNELAYACMTVLVGNTDFDFASQSGPPSSNAQRTIRKTITSFHHNRESVPVSIKAFYVCKTPAITKDYKNELKGIVNVNLTLAPTTETINQWKIETYGKLVKAYNEKEKEYQEWLNSQYAYSGMNIQGNNPEINRANEREELKKRCIELYSGQRFESFDAATNGLNNAPVSNYPEILFQEAIREGNIVKFFEQAFEWENMTYIFYPYFWGRKKNWLSIKNLSNNDPLFTKFLQAGYARVVVPARPGFEKFVMDKKGLGQWLSGAALLNNNFNWVPGIDDAYYYSIAAELQASNAWKDDSQYPVVSCYQQKVPTNLVYLAPINPPANNPMPGLPDYSAEVLFNNGLPLPCLG